MSGTENIGGCKTYGNAEYYMNQLRNDKNFKQTTTKNGDNVWTGFTNKDGIHMGHIFNDGKNTYINVNGETFVDDNNDGTIDRSWIKDKNGTTFYNSCKPGCVHNRKELNPTSLWEFK